MQSWPSVVSDRKLRSDRTGSGDLRVPNPLDETAPGAIDQGIEHIQPVAHMHDNGGKARDEKPCIALPQGETVPGDQTGQDIE